MIPPRLIRQPLIETASVPGHRPDAPDRGPPTPSIEQLESHLSSRLGVPVKILRTRTFGTGGDPGGKAFGYGAIRELQFDANGRAGRCIVQMIDPQVSGHEELEDRAHDILWSHRAYNRLPRHVQSIDVGAVRGDGGLVSLGEVRDFFLLVEFADGQPYAGDLVRIRDDDCLARLDRERADALCDYLVEIHRVACDDPARYLRRTRELLGHSECIMGVIDGYPPDHPIVTSDFLKRVEHACVEWRWKIRRMGHRLRQVHGDFHPWNILFRGGTDFSVLDRSRGEWGDPADDVTSLTMNYLFFALQSRRRLDGAMQELFLRFWDRYLRRSGDSEILRVAAPYLAFRGLVLASPVWYPRLDDDVRRQLMRFIEHVLAADAFDPQRCDEYCGV